MKTRYVIGALIIIAAVSGSVYLLSQSEIQYTTIAQARTLGRKVQIKGRWDTNAQTSYDQNRNLFRFTLIDDEGNRILVEYTGAKPNNFELAHSVVVRGRVEGERFHASEILTKCPSKYEGTSPLVPRTE
jgi:cytochrome c-type biogenesis protein CcmE